MPPPVSDEETSNQDEEVGVSANDREKSESKLFVDSEAEHTPEAGAEAGAEAEAEAEAEAGAEAEPEAEQEGGTGDAEIEEEGEDVYVVEAIKGHLTGKDGLRFRVKWEGYEDENDMTWEPEENLTGSASEVLNAYYNSVGGRDLILNEKNKKKRGRISTGTPNSKANDNKRARNSDARHPRSTTPPASLKNATFKPPTGSWEDDVQGIDACEGTDGQVMVFLQWSNGQKTQHPLHVVYKRCPQKMLKFYESHLVFKKGGGSTKEDQDVDDE